MRSVRWACEVEVETGRFALNEEVSLQVTLRWGVGGLLWEPEHTIRLRAAMVYTN